MILFLDLDSRQILDSRQSPFRSLELKRRDTDLIELQFLRDRVVQELPAGTSIRLGIKPSGDFDADFLASGTFTKSGTGTSTKYLADTNLNTTALATAFTTAEEPETLAAMLEVEWASGSNISSSKTLPVTIANDVIRGDEGEPVELPLFYTAENSDLKASQAEAEAGTNNISWMSPLRTAQAIAAWFAANPIAAAWANITGKPAAFPPETHSHSLSSLTQSGANAGQVPSWNGSEWAPATPVSGGSTSWNTLADKPTTFAPSPHSHDSSAITSGTLDIARIPTGTNSTTVALGNHTHSSLPPLNIEESTYHGYGIESEFGPSMLSFEEAFLKVDSNEVFYWGIPGELSIGTRRLVNLGAPVNANDAVRKTDLANKADSYHTHILENLSQSGAAIGQAPIWNGTAWAPGTPTASNFITQQVAQITGVSNHNLTANRWHIFTGAPSVQDHTFNLPHSANDGDLVYITFLNTTAAGFRVMRVGYEGGGSQVVHDTFENGKTYVFHYNDFDTARWRKVTFA